MERLFVYGTLAPGRPNAHILEDVQGVWQDGFVLGTLKQEGWGADLGYPGIDLSPNGEKVQGFVFESDDLTQRWQQLDEFEGPGYERVLTSVELKTGERVSAYIYQLKKP
ncbi:putative AIG2-like protein [Vibrio nigripulchritudo SO65]|uniref:gamma-glutamylcyclotransferase family protein n=1 Tax=Vibrio nigripulchritudo TaxID=28173 RepID=UPI0003B2153A|nr:gamma-glutamylcyclotransferase [Vibrio nigripulchritudo]CCN33767.1 putative AIG2-like protein [Vibrio nigripulchritudo AM115]CCN41969.1 putative AIG2-like protein [Vibrio nigripulchritudo FTn2]CCN66239.1 putative AIG2-like protein [Vibrio nigripulchritudo POn4]CCN74597.1 putative AIG2-like protein [Vibrio nigripulchritudo SO65]